jgi:hypothetical protein
MSEPPADDATPDATEPPASEPGATAPVAEAVDDADPEKGGDHADGADGADGADDAQDADGEKPSEDIAPWKLVAVVAVVLVVVAGGLLAYHYRGKIFKRSSTTTAATGPVGHVEDSFERADAQSLGKTSTGQTWQAVAGTWGITGQQAYVAVANDKGVRNFAVLDIGSGTGTVSADADKLGDGWGLLFRYQNPGAYWRLYWDTQFKAFHLVKYQDNKETNAVPGGFLAPNAHEGMNVRVEFTGPNITVFVDDTPIHTVSDPYLEDQTKVGMYVDKAGVPDARWGAFVANSQITGTPRTAPDRPPASRASTPTTG